MGSVLIVIVAAALCVLWVRANRRNRRRWLEKLDLPGTWRWADHDGVLELSGGLERGRYRSRDIAVEEEGEWRLEGHELVLEPQTGEPCRLDLRLFTDGKIGLHGPGREHRIYVKQGGNVVPLRRHG